MPSEQREITESICFESVDELRCGADAATQRLSCRFHEKVVFFMSSEKVDGCIGIAFERGRESRAGKGVRNNNR